MRFLFSLAIAALGLGVFLLLRETFASQHSRDLYAAIVVTALMFRLCWALAK